MSWCDRLFRGRTAPQLGAVPAAAAAAAVPGSLALAPVRCEPDARPPFTLAEWLATVPTFGWCTFEVEARPSRKRAVMDGDLVRVHWTVEPGTTEAGWKVVRSIRGPESFVRCQSVAELVAVLDDGRGRSVDPSQLLGTAGWCPWRPISTELAAAAILATRRGRARDGFGHPLDPATPRLGVLLHLATLHPGAEPSLLAHLQQGAEAVRIGAVPQSMTRGGL